VSRFFPWRLTLFLFKSNRLVEPLLGFEVPGEIKNEQGEEKGTA
jgi:hypothetical protein